MLGILQVLPLRECENYVLKCQKKKRQREKDRLSKNAKRQVETQEESAKRNKTIRECVTKQRQNETQEQGAKRKKNDCDRKTKQRQTETEDQGAKCKKTMRECVTKQWQTETEEQGAKRKKTDCDRKTKQRQTETVEQSTKHKKTDRDFKRRKREEMRHQFQKDGKDCTGEDMTNVINRATN